MILHGVEHLDVDPAALRAALADPEQLADALPNVDDFVWESREEGTFSATLRPALGLGEVPFHTLWRPAPAGGADAVAYDVEGRRTETRLALDVAVTLEPAGAATSARWRVGFHVTGVTHSVGQRVLAAIVTRQARDVLLRAADACSVAASHGGR